MVHLVRRSACARSSTVENLKRMNFLRRWIVPKYLFQSVMSPVDMNFTIRFREFDQRSLTGLVFLYAWWCYYLLDWPVLEECCFSSFDRVARRVSLAFYLSLDCMSHSLGPCCLPVCWCYLWPNETRQPISRLAMSKASFHRHCASEYHSRCQESLDGASMLVYLCLMDCLFHF